MCNGMEAHQRENHNGPTILQIYAPTNKYSEAEKDEFYELLQAVIDDVPRHDLLVVMGDVNAKIGAQREGKKEL